MGEKPDNMKKTTKRISAEQKSALEAAGYKVKGSAVLDKDGKTLGGFNENGQVSSGSSKVTAILKSKPTAPAAKAPTPTASKSAPPAKRAAPVAKGMSTADLTKRASAAIDRAKPVARKQPARPITPTPKTTPKPKSVAGTIGSAIGGWEGRQRKPVTFPESKGTTNPISKAAGGIGGALGSMAAKISTALSKPTPPKLRPLTAADRDRTAAISAKRLEEMRKRRGSK